MFREDFIIQDIATPTDLKWDFDPDRDRYIFTPSCDRVDYKEGILIVPGEKDKRDFRGLVGKTFGEYKDLSGKRKPKVSKVPIKIDIIDVEGGSFVFPNYVCPMVYATGARDISIFCDGSSSSRIMADGSNMLRISLRDSKIPLVYGSKSSNVQVDMTGSSNGIFNFDSSSSVIIHGRNSRGSTVELSLSYAALLEGVDSEDMGVAGHNLVNCLINAKGSTSMVLDLKKSRRASVDANCNSHERQTTNITITADRSSEVEIDVTNSINTILYTFFSRRQSIITAGARNITKLTFSPNIHGLLSWLSLKEKLFS